MHGAVTEWLRCTIRNRLGLSRVGSSPASIDLFLFTRPCYCVGNSNNIYFVGINKNTLHPLYSFFSEGHVYCNVFFIDLSAQTRRTVLNE